MPKGVDGDVSGNQHVVIIVVGVRIGSRGSGDRISHLSTILDRIWHSDGILPQAGFRS